MAFSWLSWCCLWLEERHRWASVEFLIAHLLGFWFERAKDINGTDKSLAFCVITVTGKWECKNDVNSCSPKLHLWNKADTCHQQNVPNLWLLIFVWVFRKSSSAGQWRFTSGFLTQQPPDPRLQTPDNCENSWARETWMSLQAPYDKGVMLGRGQLSCYSLNLPSFRGTEKPVTV